MIASSKAGFDINGGLAPNGFDAHSPGGYTMMAGLTAGADSSERDSGDELEREPGAEHGSGVLCGRLGAGAVVCNFVAAEE